jgi:Fe-S cluster assembly protein SufD
MLSTSSHSKPMCPQFLTPEFFESFSAKRSWEPGWLADFRKDSWGKFLSLPKTRTKDERWRFSPRARLGYSNFEQLAENPKPSVLLGHKTDGILFDTLDQTILNTPSNLLDLPNLHGPNLGADDTFLLGCCFSELGIVLKSDKGVIEKKPFKQHHFAPNNNQSLFQTNIISLEPFSELTVIEFFESEDEGTGGISSNLSHIKLGEGAKLNRILVQKVNQFSTFNHLENIQLARNSELTNISLHLGGAQSRIESKGVIAGEGASFNNFSLSLGNGEQLFDQRTVQHHIAPHGKSNLLFKNALLDESKSIFSGLIKVDHSAQHTDAYQTNRNLLLSAHAEADSLPGLEILANEVKCSHGATTSKIDEQELFYLLSRGIHRNVAEKLIVLGFFDEIIREAGTQDEIDLLRDEITHHFN